MVTNGRMATPPPPMSFMTPRTAGRALIDFEIMHERSMPAEARHADDLLFFTRHGGKRFEPAMAVFPLCFLNAYGAADVVAEIRNGSFCQVVGGGFGGSRTQLYQAGEGNATAGETSHRNQALVFIAASAERARNKRRPSITLPDNQGPECRWRTRSTLAIKERAKAASPGMPRRLADKKIRLPARPSRPNSKGGRANRQSHACRMSAWTNVAGRRAREAQSKFHPNRRPAK